MHKHIKELFALGKTMQWGHVNSYQLINYLHDFMKDKPCCLLRVIFEKILFPDHLMNPNVPPSE